MLSDLLILKKIKEGDITVYEQVFRQYYTSLCFYAFGITQRKDIAEEIVQELFYVLWRDRGSIEILRSLKNYLYAAVRNQSLHYLEHQQVRMRYYESHYQENSELSPQETLEYKELETLVEQTLKKMPERRSQIFEMHRFKGEKYKDIAKSMSVSVKTVEAEMTKAYKMLRLELEKYRKEHE